MKKEGNSTKKTARHKELAAPPKRTPNKPKQTIAAVVPPSQPLDTLTTENSTSPPSRKHTLKRWLIIGSIVTTVIIWGLCSFLFSSVTLGTTRIHDDVSNTELTAQLTTQAKAYQLPITAQGHTEAFPLQAIGAQINIPATIQNIRHAEGDPLHILAWWEPEHVDIALIMPTTALRQFIAANLTTTTHAAQNASLKIVNGSPQITPAATGTAYTLPDAETTIVEAIKHLQTTPLQLTTITLNPTVTAQTLANIKTQLQAILDQHITITVGGQTVTPSAADIAGWVTVTPTTTGANLGIDSSTVQQYLQSVANAHDQPAQSEVVLTNTETVLSSGQRGVVVGSTTNASDAISQGLLRGNGLQTSLPVSYTDYTTVQAPTDGKWIEVNITTKRMYTYDQGQLVRSFLVSAGAPRTPTVIGTFAIYAKYVSQDMYGENVDGSSYFQPNVPYVNYFYSDYAIHGNYWRPSNYFGNINSSHGCVGLPVSDSAWVYNWAPIGTPVIVHT